MLNKIKSKIDLIPFFTNVLLENGVGVLIDEAMPQESYIVINIDEYYHRKGQKPTPEIADIFIIAQRLSNKELHQIYIVEMKNISSPRRFDKDNIIKKFNTAIEDFMKIKYSDVFMDESYKVEKFKLYFVNDAYRLKKRGMTEEQINSFLLETKIMLLNSIQCFTYRNFIARIEPKLPNPLLEWY